MNILSRVKKTLLGVLEDSGREVANVYYLGDIVKRIALHASYRGRMF